MRIVSSTFPQVEKKSYSFSFSALLGAGDRQSRIQHYREAARIPKEASLSFRDEPRIDAVRATWKWYETEVS